jgi:outer membrane biosynthesis protein TonB
MRRPFTLATIAVLGLALAGCSSWDPTDWFSTKKPLPGDRREVFPGGVPGVPHGVPPELVEGYQPPPEPPPQVAETPPEPPKKKPKPKPKTAAAPARPATAVTIQPVNRGGAPSSASQQPSPQQPAEAQSPWPAPQQSASSPTQTRWPDPPPAH